MTTPSKSSVAAAHRSLQNLPSHAVSRWAYRIWLRARIDSYTRDLHAIAAQRDNDFYAERLLHRALSATRSKLQSLS